MGEKQNGKSLGINVVSINQIILQENQLNVTKLNQAKIASNKLNYIDMKVLKRGVIGIRKIGYI